MKYLGENTVTATEKIRDDAFQIFMPRFMAEKKIVFRFEELKWIHAMCKKDGMISAGKAFTQMKFLWEGEEWLFNASTVFDEMCLKYEFYPRYLADRNLHPAIAGEKTQFEPEEKDDQLPF